MVVRPRARGAENSIPQMRWLGAALATRRIEALKNSELRFGWRRGCYNNDWTEDVNDISGVRRAWVSSRVRIQIGFEKKLSSAHDDDWIDVV